MFVGTFFVVEIIATRTTVVTFFWLPVSAWRRAASAWSAVYAHLAIVLHTIVVALKQMGIAYRRAASASAVNAGLHIVMLTIVVAKAS